MLVCLVCICCVVVVVVVVVCVTLTLTVHVTSPHVCGCHYEMCENMLELLA